jgi:hypothetical protein
MAPNPRPSGWYNTALFGLIYATERLNVCVCVCVCVNGYKKKGKFDQERNK